MGAEAHGDALRRTGDAMQGVRPLRVRHAAAMLVVATLAPHVLAWIGLPLALLLAPGSAWVALFLTFLFSPLFALPIALCLGLRGSSAVSSGRCIVTRSRAPSSKSTGPRAGTVEQRTGRGTACSTTRST